MQIYFLKPEKIFEQYADEEAEIWYANEKKKHEEREMRDRERN